MRHLEVSFAVFPLFVGPSPHGHVGRVHDGDEDVEHEDDDDHLVAAPDAEADEMWELVGPVLLVLSRGNHLHAGGTVWLKHQPEHFAPKIFRGGQIAVFREGVVVIRVLVCALLERLQEWPQGDAWGDVTENMSALKMFLWMSWMMIIVSNTFDAYMIP